MFEEQMYRNLASKSSFVRKRPIDIKNPWFPKQRPKKEQKEEYKFFVLPPNKMISLLKKQKLVIPTDEQIREYIKSHSLKYIVYHGTEFKQQPISIKNVPIPTSPRNNNNYSLKSIKRSPIQIKPQSTSPQKAQKISRHQDRELSQQELYIHLKRHTHSPENVLQSTRQDTKPKSPENHDKQIPYLQSQVPKSVLPYPQRTKKQLRTLLIRALRKIRALNLSPQFVLKHRVFSKKPYEKSGSRELIHAAKKNLIEEVEFLLKQNPYLVFDFDFYNMTALHWACKKGYFEMAELLVKNFADVDAVDVLNRTPLILTIQENYLNIAHMLLLNGAYPWSTAVTDLKFAIEQNPKAKYLLTSARRLDIVSQFTRKEFMKLI